MSDWNAEQYLKFKSQRTQPAEDLARRILTDNPQSVLDVGCGPGNSTRVLKNRFPKAHIIGVDSSETMIQKAKETCPDIEFQVMDITEEHPGLENLDVIFSNACLQWIPHHREFVPKLFGRLRRGGVLAVQIPMNSQERLFTILSETVCEPQWDFSSLSLQPNTTLTCEEYFDLLASLTPRFDIWETVYYHPMPSVEAMVEWMKGARLRPYLNALSEKDAQALVTEITEKASKAYTPQKNGEILFKFRRCFFTATRCP